MGNLQSFEGELSEGVSQVGWLRGLEGALLEGR